MRSLKGRDSEQHGVAGQQPKRARAASGANRLPGCFPQPRHGFKWSDGAGIFVQTAFPGIFPNLTRYQAELDQNNMKTGQDPWKNNAVQVAQRMAAQLLKWSPNAAAGIVSGGGPQDVDAVVQVKGSNPGSMSINVTLSRLEGTTSSMWVDRRDVGHRPAHHQHAGERGSPDQPHHHHGHGQCL